MSALSFAAFMAELAVGYAMSHPAPFFVALGVLGTGCVVGIAFAIANRVMARDDMPLSGEEQETLRVFQQMTAELRHELPVPAAPALVQHAHARHARPGPLRRTAGRLADWWHGLRQSAPEMPPAPERIDAWVATLRPRTWAVDALARQVLTLPAPRVPLALPVPKTGDGPAPVRAVTTQPAVAGAAERPARATTTTPQAGGHADLAPAALPGPGSEPSGATGPAPACRHCHKPLRRCTRTKSRGFIHASGDCKGWVHAIDGWHSCVREGPAWVFAEPAPDDVPGRAPAPAHTPGPPPSPAREGSGAGPAGDPRWPWLDRPWADETGSFAAICREGT